MRLSVFSLSDFEKQLFSAFTELGYVFFFFEHVDRSRYFHLIKDVFLLTLALEPGSLVIYLQIPIAIHKIVESYFEIHYSMGFTKLEYLQKIFPKIFYDLCKTLLTIFEEFMFKQIYCLKLFKYPKLTVDEFKLYKLGEIRENYQKETLSKIWKAFDELVIKWKKEFGIDLTLSRTLRERGMSMDIDITFHYKSLRDYIYVFIGAPLKSIRFSPIDEKLFNELIKNLGRKDVVKYLLYSIFQELVRIL